MNKLAICMPVYNEQDGILDWITELTNQFPSKSVKFIIVDDASTDASFEVLYRESKKNQKIILVKNDVNLGHGPSLIRALSFALKHNFLNVMSMDGDGQCSAWELKAFYEGFVRSKLNYGEANRINRLDPFYRQIVSKITKIVTSILTKSKVVDANTPIRLYKRKTLNELLKIIELDCLVPNLVITKIIRLRKIKTFNSSVNWSFRRGKNPVGSTWSANQKFNYYLPNIKFVKFCFKASKYYFKKRQIDFEN